MKKIAGIDNGVSPAHYDVTNDLAYCSSKELLKSHPSSVESDSNLNKVSSRAIIERRVNF